VENSNPNTPSGTTPQRRRPGSDTDQRKGVRERAVASGKASCSAARNTGAPDWRQATSKATNASAT
jgi:hypothetical protein